MKKPWKTSSWKTASGFAAPAALFPPFPINHINPKKNFRRQSQKHREGGEDDVPLLGALDLAGEEGLATSGQRGFHGSSAPRPAEAHADDEGEHREDEHLERHARGQDERGDHPEECAENVVIIVSVGGSVQSCE